MAGLVFLLVFWVLAGACQRHGVGGFLLCNTTTTKTHPPTPPKNAKKNIRNFESRLPAKFNSPRLIRVYTFPSSTQRRTNTADSRPEPEHGARSLVRRPFFLSEFNIFFACSASARPICLPRRAATPGVCPSSEGAHVPQRGGRADREHERAALAALERRGHKCVDARRQRRDLGEPTRRRPRAWPFSPLSGCRWGERSSHKTTSARDVKSQREF